MAMSSPKENESEGDKPKEEQLAPEGGWGYMVALGKAITFTVTVGLMPSFGLIFGQFLENLGESTSAITLLNSVFFSTISLSGLLAIPLFKKFSYRTVGMMGIISYCFGSFLNIFVTSITQMIFSFSVFQGVGLGLMMPACFTCFNSYFVKKRATVLAFSHMLVGIGTMVFPFIIQTLMETYGFRGTLALIAAMNCNAVFGMMLMQPVGWHWKKPKETVEMVTIKKIPPNENLITKTHFEEKSPEQVKPLLANYDSNKVLASNQEHTLMTKDAESGSIKSMKPLKMLQNEERSRRSSSITSLGNWTGPVVTSGIVEEKKGKIQAVVDFLDLTLLKDWIYVNMVVGVSVVMFTDITFFSLQPLYLMTIDWTKASIAICISAGATADLVSKGFIAVASIWIKTSSRYVFLAGAIMSAVARVGFIYATDFTSVVVITAIMGFFRTWVHVPISLMFAEYFSQQRFPSAYGLLMFLQGVIMFMLGPIVGYIRDATHSYTMCFHALTACFFVCIVPWLIEAAIFKCKPQKAKEDKL